MALVYEDKRLGFKDPKLQKIVDESKKLMDTITKESIAKGIIKQTFSERMLSDLQKEMNELKSKRAVIDRDKKLKEIADIMEEIKNMRYFFWHCIC